MSISVEEGEGKWPTAGTLAMLDEHLTDLAAYRWGAEQLLSAAQRDLKVCTPKTLRKYFGAERPIDGSRQRVS